MTRVSLSAHQVPGRSEKGNFGRKEGTGPSCVGHNLGNRPEAAYLLMIGIRTLSSIAPSVVTIRK